MHIQRETVALDVEIVNSIDEKTFTFAQPWGLGVGVAVTYTPETGCRDWFGGGRTPEWHSADIHYLVQYLCAFERVVTFNGVAFDYRVLDGYLDPGWRYTPAVNRPWELVGPLLAGSSIDLLLDLEEAHGRRLSLDACMLGSFDHGKAEDSAKIPEMWRNGLRHEVIGHCREHTEMTYKLWEMGENEGKIRFQYGDTLQSVSVKWRLR